MNQTSIFGSTEESGGDFSQDRYYRYTLWRKFGNGPTLVSICCNPSTADETVNDPTVAGMVKRAKMWGFGKFVMLNLFAWRATDPRELKKTPLPVGEMNDGIILLNCTAVAVTTVICAWGGCSPLIPERAEFVKCYLRGNGVRLHYLRLGKTGIPCHPLYLPHKLKPEVWV